jgi:signal transduction histidine kinase
MGTDSLRLRLSLLAALAISLALAAAGVGFYLQFQKHAQNLMLQEFDAHFEQLAANVSVGDDSLQIDEELSDPRFSRQYGGLYWQIDVKDHESLRSRSLWDFKLNVPTPPATIKEDAHIHILKGPNDSTLLSLERIVTFEKPDGTEIPAVVTLAIDRASVSNAISAFSNEMVLGLGLLYIVLLGSSVLQILVGLRPLEAVRSKLEGIRSGSQERMDGSYPKEVQSLVQEVNSLLDAREDQLKRTRNRAGNMAHGLKTPLTVLDAVAHDLENDGKRSTAKEIKLATSDMRNIVDRELARSRSSSRHGSVRTPLLPVLQRIRDTLTKASAAKLNWHFDVAADATVPFEKDDLYELAGNLLENAQKFASGNIYVSYTDSKLVIEDDGPGVPEDKIAHVLQRGARLDEKKPGSGLGLAIVQDLADAYGAQLSLTRSKHGGLRVALGLDRPQIAREKTDP